MHSRSCKTSGFRSAIGGGLAGLVRPLGAGKNGNFQEQMELANRRRKITALAYRAMPSLGGISGRNSGQNSARPANELDQNAILKRSRLIRDATMPFSPQRKLPLQTTRPAYRTLQG